MCSLPCSLLSTRQRTAPGALLDHRVWSRLVQLSPQSVPFAHPDTSTHVLDKTRIRAAQNVVIRAYNSSPSSAVYAASLFLISFTQDLQDGPTHVRLVSHLTSCDRWHRQRCKGASFSTLFSRRVMSPQFQQESLAALVRHYRNQCLQLSATCDRLRNERRSLRKLVLYLIDVCQVNVPSRDFDTLRREHHLCRSRGFAMDQPLEQAAHLNHNGKRPMVDIQR